MTDTKRKIVLSGIRATGREHLGNYLGALQHFVRLAKDPANDCYFFIADLHSITSSFSPKAIIRDRPNIVLDFLGAGLDPEDATLYCQSSIPETTELAWILSCLIRDDELLGLNTFLDKKAKLAEKNESATVGLLCYPVLMAADILGPRADVVPVGEDQHIHLEIARNVARKFNKQFGETFPVPEFMDQEGLRVRSLSSDGKMGKSEDPRGTIYLSDPIETSRKKVQRALVDPARARREDPGNPDVCNFFALHEILSTDEEKDEIRYGCTTAAIGCLECKAKAFQHVREILEPFQERRNSFEAKGPDFVRQILQEGGKKARARVVETVTMAKRRAGVPAY